MEGKFKCRILCGAGYGVEDGAPNKIKCIGNKEPLLNYFFDAFPKIQLIERVVEKRFPLEANAQEQRGEMRAQNVVSLLSSVTSSVAGCPVTSFNRFGRSR